MCAASCAHATPSLDSLYVLQVLNDSWVSVPTGSEDFSFKNMRKNQYEEALFRCEDERYEIDMVIDNNASAIQCLMPLNAEIVALKQVEGFDWQFRLDRRSLGVLHLKAVARIYGEHGNEVTYFYLGCVLCEIHARVFLCFPGSGAPSQESRRRHPRPSEGTPSSCDKLVCV